MKYNELFEQILDNSVTCCDLLNQAIDLINHTKVLVAMEFGTIPKDWGKLCSYWSDRDSTLHLTDLRNKACEGKSPRSLPPGVVDALLKEQLRLSPIVKERERQRELNPHPSIGPGPSEAEKERMRLREEEIRLEWWWKAPFLFLFGPGGDYQLMDPDGKVWPSGIIWELGPGGGGKKPLPRPR